MTLNDDKRWTIVLLLCLLPLHSLAQDLVKQGALAKPQQHSMSNPEQMAPPPPGPYLADQRLRPVSQKDAYQPQATGPYEQPHYPPAQMPQTHAPYDRQPYLSRPRPQAYSQPYHPAQAPRSYYQQYEQGYVPAYPAQPPYSQPGYMNPYRPTY